MRHLTTTTDDIGRRILRAAASLQEQKAAAGASPLDITDHLAVLRSIARSCFRNADAEMPPEADNPPTGREQLKGWHGDPDITKNIAEYYGVGKGPEPDPDVPVIRGPGITAEEAAPATGPEEVRGSPDLVRANVEAFPAMAAKQQEKERKAEERARAREFPHYTESEKARGARMAAVALAEESDPEPERGGVSTIGGANE